ncbi:MAG: PDZ domain-containing protein [Halanaerobiales bacterium]|nr:PDZ domain-containing protein [Halanaerobiales bacterium]
MNKDKLTKGIGILIIIFIIINFIPTSYYLMSPGLAKELSSIITVEGGYKDQIEGSFLLTAVGSQKATVWDYIYLKTFSPAGYELELLTDQLPENINMERYLQMMADLMEESKLTAEAVALQKNGYDIQVHGGGVEIIEVLESSAAYNKLKSGDTIVEVDGQKTELASEAVDIIRKREIGDEVKLAVMRNNNKITINVETIELAEDPGKASIGILITTKNLSYNFPVKVEYKTGNIVGPSAGGMFALEIYNQLVKEDLTMGKKIAGTGTINLKGEIGEIDGVVQKILAAQKAGAEIFILPIENQEEAKKANINMKLIPVRTFDDVIDYLNKQKLKTAA